VQSHLNFNRYGYSCSYFEIEERAEAEMPIVKVIQLLVLSLGLFLGTSVFSSVSASYVRNSGCFLSPELGLG